MTPELKTQWVEALKSGKYKKGIGKLRNIDNTYCCFGVLCDILIPNNWELKVDSQGKLNYYFNFDGFWNFRSFPNFYLRNIELSERVKVKLEIINDKNNKTDSFESIAVYIKDNL